MLLEAWMENAIACCELCGVAPPSTVTDHFPHEDLSGEADLIHCNTLRAPQAPLPQDQEVVVSCVSFCSSGEADS